MSDYDTYELYYRDGCEKISKIGITVLNNKPTDTAIDSVT